MLVEILPPTARPERLAAVTSEYVRVTGLHQVWQVFAPSPRDQVIALEARVRYADGRTTVWRPPSNGPLLGAYRDYRWRKYVEHAVRREPTRSPETWPRLWEPLALYAAQQEQRPGTWPVRVTLVSRNTSLAPPDDHGLAPPKVWEGAYLTLALPHAGDRVSER